jgi:hypothetical protein
MQAASRAQGLRAFDALGWLLGAAVCGYLLAFPRVLGRSDESVVLYGAKRVLQGQALYKDFFEFITPVSFYFFAAVFAVTGPSLLAARVAMAVINAASCVLVFRLARRVAGPPEAALAAGMFGVTCVPAWLYASPHWLSTMLCLATAAAVLGDGFEAAPRRQAAVAGALAGLTFCVQQQRGVFLGVWVVAAMLILTYAAPAGSLRRRVLPPLAWMLGAWVAVTLTILGYSAWRASVGALLQATVGFVFKQYYPAVHGTDVAGSVSWAGVCALCGAWLPYAWRPLLRGVPVLLVAEVVALAWGFRRRCERAMLVRACVVLLAGLMAASILYYPDFIHVAFIAPFALIVAARLARGMWTWLPQHTWWARLVPQLVMAMLVLATLRKAWANIELAWAQAPEQFDSAVGTLRGTAADRQLLEAVQRVLDGAPSQRHTLYSYPADAWLYLAVPGDNPTRFAILQRGYNAAEHFNDALAALEKSPPDCLVINVGMLRADDPVIAFERDRYRRVATVGFYEVYDRIRSS